ncbi:MAG: ATP-binding protein [Verrucomicrobiales bacterium]|nr:ATP-binding protein [Verrucomicrobiales bacterium]
MPKLPGANETIELIDQLTSSIRAFAEREGKLNYALKLKSSNLAQSLREEIEQIQARTESGIEELQAAAESRRAAVEERFETRRARLGKARISARKSMLERIEKEEGYRKYGIQKNLIESNQRRDQALQELEDEHRQAVAKFDAVQGKFGKLEVAARRAMRGFSSFTKNLAGQLKAGSAETRSISNVDKEFQKLTDLYQSAGIDLGRLRKKPLAQLFGAIPMGLQLFLVVLLAGGAVPLLHVMELDWLNYTQAGIIGGVLLLLILLVFFITRSGAAGNAKALTESLREARAIRNNLIKHLDESREARIAQIREDHERATGDFQSGLEETAAAAGAERASRPEEIEEKAERVTAKLESACTRSLETIDSRFAAKMEEVRTAAENRISELNGSTDSADSGFVEEHQQQWDALESEWKTTIPDLLERAREARIEADREFPEWTSDVVESWSPPPEFRPVAKFGDLAFDLESAVEKLPEDPRLTLPGGTDFKLPLALRFPESGSILFETQNAGNDTAVASLNNLILRILTGAPAGRVTFTIIDPVGLGQNFAGVMHLADHEEFLINSRIWTQPQQIEQRLSELSDHMEKVIQMYLRNEYSTITEYNEKAGNIAEKYHYVVVADFPHAFSEAAANRLLSIASTGARCGVYTLIHWDQRQQLPGGFTGEDLRKSSVCLKTNQAGFFLPANSVSPSELHLDSPPPDDLAVDLVHRIGQASKDSNRIEVPFSHIAPETEADFWSMDTTEELIVPIGRTGATKLQQLAIGKGTCQHALIAGKTGSGKSTLFHVIITNLALWCDPDRVEFYLIDFKKGVEFKCYADAKLPHARVIAIESDREFGLSVLQRLDEELKRRGELFRKLGVQDLAGYKRAGGTEALPRSLLLIDEFQEFFVEDDQISQNAALLLDRIVRQGRAFGIHAILGSQTLGGAFTLARATLGQMVIRIALQCNEADAYLIMDDSNPAPRMLTRPGEGIYNDQAGAVEGNSPFQVVWLGDEERDEWLARTRPLIEKFESSHAPVVVFEGNAPAAVSENLVLEELLGSFPPEKRPAAARLFIGAPNSIKGPTEVVFQPQSGNNLLIIGQQEESILSMLTIGITGFHAQYPENGILQILIDGSPAGSSEADYFDAALPESVERPSLSEIGDCINGLAAEMRSRLEDATAAQQAAPVFVFINGLQKFKKLRFEEDFSFSMDDSPAEAKPGDSLNDLISEGASVGIHLIAVLDTFNNLNRALNRKAISEFEMRVLFQMSANDSASLIDSMKASTLGLNRALFYNEQAGYLETFRPYALPAKEWFSK